MSTGLIVATVVLALFAVWGVALKIWRREPERPSETSSHSESGAGTSPGGGAQN